MAGRRIFYSSLSVPARNWVNDLPRGTRNLGNVRRPIKTEVKLNFEDHNSAFRHKSTAEIFRALSILQLCGVDAFVNNSLKIMKGSQRVLGDRLFDAIIRPTFYDQFVAGDDRKSMKKTIDRLDQCNVRPMIACMMEDDECITGAEKEKEFDENLRRIINCIELLGEGGTKRPTLQVKMTGIMSVPLVMKVGQLSNNEEVQLKLSKAFAKNMASSDSKLPSADLEDLADMKKELVLALIRLRKIGEAAQEHGVIILIDAEYISMNRGLNTFAVAMMAAFNKDRPWVWDTIQCYLKEAFNNAQRLLRLTNKLGVCSGAKIVRGAYMDRERELAREKGYTSPVNETYEATGQMYNKVVGSMLKQVKEVGDRCNIVIATHNEHAIRTALQTMRDLGINTSNGSVNFAQLYGMCEQVTVPLAQSGLIVYKSIPYGSVSEVLPYLYRRATENRSVLDGARKERTLLWKALKSRIL